jgi:long-subunit fatty acid transport protein
MNNDKLSMTNVILNEVKNLHFERIDPSLALRVTQRSLVIGILFVIWILSFNCFAVDTGQAGLDIAVLKAGVGARALGMGSAFTAVADNADAPFWNPAGLSRIKDNEITAMQTKLSTDADHYYVSYVTPLFGGGL